jgi:tetratricopeptide (TPR) repeat protein
MLAGGRTAIVVIATVIICGLAGCDPKETVKLSYDRPARHELPSAVRSIGIAEFGGQDSDDKEWGDIASDRVAAELHQANQRFDRYELVDRKRLKAILDEQDLQAAFATTDAAVTAGKIAKTDAMIYGTVNVVTRDDEVERTTFDPLARGMKTKTSTRRYVLAEVNFTLVDVGTSQVLATVPTKHEFDSEKSGSGGGAATMMKMVGAGGSDLPAADQVVSQLIDQCVADFVATISPHQVVETVELLGGKSDAVKTGNTLAAAGDYAEALEAYEIAISQNPQDHEAIFNAGVAHEALGQLDQAHDCYDRAFKIKPEAGYVAARKRVRTENGN